jgi:NitT/TauT family transport system substrate-binding protein
VNQHSSLKDQRFSYEQSDVDALATTVSEALAICQEKLQRCPRLVLVLDESIGGDQLIAHRRIPGLAVLRGQKVGLERSVLGEYLLLRALETVGLGLGDVELVYAGPRALIDLMRQQGLAAVVTYSPYSASLVNQPSHHTLFSSSQLPRDVVDVLAVSPDFAQRHPQQVEALVNTWRQARRRPAEAQALMARREGIPVEDFLRSEAMLRYVDESQQRVWLKPGGWMETTVRRMAQRLQAAGRLPYAMPLPEVTSQWAGGDGGP